MSNWIIVNHLSNFDLDLTRFEGYKVINAETVVSDIGVSNALVGRKYETLTQTRELSIGIRLKQETKRFRILLLIRDLETFQRKYGGYATSYFDTIDVLVFSSGEDTDALYAQLACYLRKFEE